MNQAQISAQHREMRRQLAMAGPIPGGNVATLERATALPAIERRGVPPDFYLSRDAVRQAARCEYQGCGEPPVATRWRGAKLLALCPTHSNLFDRLRA
jgi:ribosomal protein S14